MNVLEESLQKLKQESDQEITTVNGYKVCSKTLEEKVEREKMTSTSALQELKQLQVELHRLRDEPKIFNRAIEELLSRTSGTGRSGERTSARCGTGIYWGNGEPGHKITTFAVAEP